MKRPFSSLGSSGFPRRLTGVDGHRRKALVGEPAVHAVLRRITLLAALALVSSPQVAPAGEAPASRVMRPVRRVHVHRVWSAPGMETDAQSGMSLYAHVEAVGLKWRSLLVEVRLRTADGKPVRVTAKAPKEYADDKGRFSMSTHAPVFDDPFEWNELRASIPYEKVLDLSAERPQRLIATFRVSCEGLSSVSESEITIPPSEPPGVTRAIRLLAIDPFPNTLPPAGEGRREGSLPLPRAGEGRGEGSLPTPKRERIGVRGTKQLNGRSPSSPDPDSPPKPDHNNPATRNRGLTVEAYVEAIGLDGQTMTGRLSFRHENGKPLLSIGRNSGAPKPLADTRQSAIVSDQAQILPHFVDYRSLRLQTGPHRLILSYSADCAGLTATMEEEHVLQYLTIDE